LDVKISQNANIQNLQFKLFRMEQITELINEIYIQRNSGARTTGKFPDFVMINPEAKHLLKEQFANLANTVTFDERVNEMKIFGMQIIWTETVELDKPVCTYKSV